MNKPLQQSSTLDSHGSATPAVAATVYGHPGPPPRHSPLSFLTSSPVPLSGRGHEDDEEGDEYDDHYHPYGRGRRCSRPGTYNNYDECLFFADKKDLVVSTFEDGGHFNSHSSDCISNKARMTAVVKSSSPPFFGTCNMDDAHNINNKRRSSSKSDGIVPTTMSKTFRPIQNEDDDKYNTGEKKKVKIRLEKMKDLSSLLSSSIYSTADTCETDVVSERPKGEGEPDREQESIIRSIEDTEAEIPDEIVGLKPLPAMAGTKRRHGRSHPPSVPVAADLESIPNSSSSADTNSSNPQRRRYHRRNSFLIRLNGSNGDGQYAHDDMMVMKAMAMAADVSSTSQYVHDSILYSKHRRTNTSDVVLTGTPPSHRYSFSSARRRMRNFEQAEDMIVPLPPSPTTVRPVRPGSRHLLPPPLFQDGNSPGATATPDTNIVGRMEIEAKPKSTTGVSSDELNHIDHASMPPPPPPTEAAASVASRSSERLTNSQSRYDIHDKVIDADGLNVVDDDDHHGGNGMEISDHMRHMFIDDAKDEGGDSQGVNSGERNDVDIGGGSVGGTTMRRNFYSSWSDSDDTKWLMQVEEHDGT